MNKAAKSILSFSPRHPFYTIAVTIVFLVVALAALTNISFDNSVDVFFDHASDSYINFEGWKKQFGSDQVVILAFSDQDIFTYENLTLIQSLTKSLEASSYIDKVTSLTNVNDIVGDEFDFIVDPFVEEVPKGEMELKALRRRALSNPLYAGSILSSDARTTALVIELVDDKDNNAYKKEAIEEITAIADELFTPGKDYHLSGFAAIEQFYAAYMQDDAKSFMPFILAVVALVLLISFRSWPLAALTLVSIIVSLILTLALLYLFGFSVNNVTTIIPPVILAIAVADSIHIVVQVRKSRKNTQGVAEALEKLFLPCLLTSLTTMAGFFSLTASSIVPVRQLGLVAGLGVVIAFIVSFTFLPALMSLFKIGGDCGGKKEDPQADKGGGSISKKIAVFVRRNQRAIIILALILAGLSIAGALNIKSETSVIEYFKSDSPIYTATTFIEENISGVHFLNVSLKASEEDYFKQPRSLGLIESLQNFLYTIEQVDNVTSAVDYIKEINKSFNNEEDEFYRLPDSRDLIAQYILLYGATDMNDYIDFRWQWATLQIRISEHSTAALEKVILSIEDYLDKNMPSEVSSNVLGQTVLEVESNQAVTSGQIKSLIIAFLIIFFIIFLVFRDMRLGLASIVSNLLPLGMTFGIMGWCKIPLDSATSMIAAVGMGIIVDDTIHFLHSFKRAYASGLTAAEAVEAALGEKTKPIVVTSVILILGFLTVTVSRFVPTAYFGLLSALLMLNALWADLIVLPAVLLRLYEKK